MYTGPVKFFGSRFSALRRRLALGTLLAIGLVQAAASGPAPVHPLSAYLAAVGYVHQSYNNCGPASIVSVLAYYGVSADQSELARVLRPEGGYMASEVIAPFVQRYGLRATLFKGGRLEHLRQLAAAGIPVIVLQWMNRVGSAPHFRVVRGYDDHSGLMWLSDPIYGPNVYVSYANFQTLWNLYDQEFIPVYRPQQTAQVSRILGVRL